MQDGDPSFIIRPDVLLAALARRTRSFKKIWPLALVALVPLTCLAVASVSSWLVIPYLIVIAGILFVPGKQTAEAGVRPAAILQRETLAGASNAGLVRDWPAEGFAAGAARLAASPEAEDGSDEGIGDEANAIDDPGALTARRGRARGRAKLKASADLYRATWVRVGPGKFVRMEEPASSPVDSAEPFEIAASATPAPHWVEPVPARSADPSETQVVVEPARASEPAADPEHVREISPAYVIEPTDAVETAAMGDAASDTSDRTEPVFADGSIAAKDATLAIESTPTDDGAQSFELPGQAQLSEQSISSPEYDVEDSVATNDSAEDAIDDEIAEIGDAERAEELSACDAAPEDRLDDAGAVTPESTDEPVCADELPSEKLDQEQHDESEGDACASDEEPADETEEVRADEAQESMADAADEQEALALDEEAEALDEEDDALEELADEQEALALDEEAEALGVEGDVLEEVADEQEAEALDEEAGALEGEGDAFEEVADEQEAEALDDEAEALEVEGDVLEEVADGLEAEADAAEADALEAVGDEPVADIADDYNAERETHTEAAEVHGAELDEQGDADEDNSVVEVEGSYEALNHVALAEYSEGSCAQPVDETTEISADEAPELLVEKLNVGGDEQGEARHDAGVEDSEEPREPCEEESKAVAGAPQNASEKLDIDPHDGLEEAVDEPENETFKDDVAVEASESTAEAGEDSDAELSNKNGIEAGESAIAEDAPAFEDAPAERDRQPVLEHDEPNEPELVHPDESLAARAEDSEGEEESEGRAVAAIAPVADRYCTQANNAPGEESHVPSCVISLAASTEVESPLAQKAIEGASSAQDVPDESAGEHYAELLASAAEVAGEPSIDSTNTDASDGLARETEPEPPPAAVDVDTTRLDDESSGELVEESFPAPEAAIPADVEGGECCADSGARSIDETDEPTLVASTEDHPAQPVEPEDEAVREEASRQESEDAYDSEHDAYVSDAEPCSGPPAVAETFEDPRRDAECFENPADEEPSEYEPGDEAGGNDEDEHEWYDPAPTCSAAWRSHRPHLSRAGRPRLGPRQRSSRSMGRPRQLARAFQRRIAPGGRM